MARVCAHCGELFPEKRLNCPHCGADADLPWSEPPYDPGLDVDEGSMDEASYEAFLRREGLSSDRPPARRARPAPRVAPLLALILLFVIAVLLWAIL